MKADLKHAHMVKLELVMTLGELTELNMMMHQIIASSGWRDASKNLADDVLGVIEKFSAREIQ